MSSSLGAGSAPSRRPDGAVKRHGMTPKRPLALLPLTLLALSRRRKIAADGDMALIVEAPGEEEEEDDTRKGLGGKLKGDEEEEGEEDE